MPDCRKSHLIFQNFLGRPPASTGSWVRPLTGPPLSKFPGSAPDYTLHTWHQAQCSASINLFVCSLILSSVRTVIHFCMSYLSIFYYVFAVCSAVYKIYFTHNISFIFIRWTSTPFRHTGGNTAKTVAIKSAHPKI